MKKFTVLGSRLARRSGFAVILFGAGLLTAPLGLAQTNSTAVVTNAWRAPRAEYAAWATLHTNATQLAADRAAYVRAGGSSTASPSALFTWHRYGIRSNGVALVPVAIELRREHNPLWDWAQWLVSLAYQTGQQPPWKLDAFSATLEGWATNAIAAKAAFAAAGDMPKFTAAAVTVDQIQVAVSKAIHTRATMREQGYDLNNLPPETLVVTNVVYAPISNLTP